jgi:hypothetical protein
MLCLQLHLSLGASHSHQITMDPLGPSYKLPDGEEPPKETLMRNQPTPAAEREPGGSSGVSKTKQIPFSPSAL